MICHTTYSSPIGNLIAVAEEEHLTGLYTDENPSAAIGERVGWRDNNVFSQLGPQLAHYWEGAPIKFDLPLRPRGTNFQTLVWNALLEIPHGQTISYGELARRVGRPTAVRAVGRANGANPISIVIPCHRVIGGSGGLTGYAGGLERKRTLLLLEAALSAEPDGALSAKPKSVGRGRIGEV